MARIIVSGFWDGHKPGESAEVSDDTARNLINRGEAVADEGKGSTKKAEEAK